VVLEFVKLLQSLPPEAVWVLLLVVAYGTLLLMLRLFGAWGVTIYIAVTLIAANLQVLKAVQFSVIETPIALGTILFSTTFLSTDILNEYFGPKTARRAVLLGFSAMLMLTLFMTLAIGFSPLPENFMGTDWEWGKANHDHLEALFLPIPSILLAGFTAYLISQILDIWIYQKIRDLSDNRFRWLRNNGSTMVSAFVDNTVFSILAWIILAPQPLEWTVVWKTYIIGTYFLRLFVALLDTPILYLAKHCLPKQANQSVPPL